MWLTPLHGTLYSTFFPPVSRWATSYAIVARALLSVPAGWEMQTTDQGIPYYVDHLNKRTSWDPPMMS
ncbi:unnamed protein product, partial [Ectocarpus sp. 8 AP-2014]